MLQLIPILVFAVTVQGHELKDDGKCNGFQADFVVRNVTGLWHVTGIVPGKEFPDREIIPCFSVDFSETDEAGLRWLVNQTKNHKPLDTVKGLSIRQRYYTKEAFDVWSKAVEGINGCFKEVLALNHSNHIEDIDATKSRNASMQLHLLKTEFTSMPSPILLQMLWSKSISAIIYSRKQYINSDQLIDVFEFMKNLRKTEKRPKTCDWPVTPL